MNHAWKRIAANAGGVITTALVVLGHALLVRLQSIDLTSFWVAVVIPLGAIFYGAGATSGLYLASEHARCRPSAPLMQTLVIAAAVVCLVPWVEYHSLQLTNGRAVSSLVPFGQYLEVKVTQAHVTVGRGLTDFGTVNDMGYWMAGLQVLGVLAGGLIVHARLRRKETCPDCRLFLEGLAMQTKSFSTRHHASGYAESLRRLPVGGPDFVQLIARKEEIEQPVLHSVRFRLMLWGCPQCKVQTLDETMDVFDGAQWISTSELDRHIVLPRGIDIEAEVAG